MTSTAHSHQHTVILTKCKELNETMGQTDHITYFSHYCEKIEMKNYNIPTMAPKALGLCAKCINCILTPKIPIVYTSPNSVKKKPNSQSSSDPQGNLLTVSPYNIMKS